MSNVSFTLNDNKTRVADYFTIVTLPPKLTNKPVVQEDTNADTTTNSNLNQDDDQFLYPNSEYELAQKLETDRMDPITDLAILNKSLNESVPLGYDCLWLTPNYHSANLLGDSLFRSNEMFLCIKRGRDKPPITDIGILYENKETVLEGCQEIRETVGRNSANLNNSSFNADRVYLTYRRGVELPCDSLAVIDVCVINKSKGEVAPHSFNEIQKNMSKSLLGSSVFLCYKKTWIPAPQIKYPPVVVYRYPKIDHVDLPFPNEIATFCLPMGAVIESWPNKITSVSNHKPVFNTFVLNVTSDDGCITEKVYGSSITFYEDFDKSKLTTKQEFLLGHCRTDASKSLHSNKSLVILSRHPLFDSFKSFLLFLFNKYIKLNTLTSLIPIERYLTYLIYDVPFPTPHKPRVLVNLTEKEDDCLSINLPNECQLPQSGASYIELIKNLGVDNTINVFLFVLLQRNLLVHSLRRGVLTGIVEALSQLIFPFIWRYSYIPMCPINLYEVVDAPGSFILGMDTRFFDIYPNHPENVICVDLDTNTISWTSDRQFINLKMLPKKQFGILQTRLQKVESDLVNLLKFRQNHSTKNLANEFEQKLKKEENGLDLAIREAFLKFMASIMFNYKQYLKTVTRRPDIKALDRNLATYFDCEGFIRSKDMSCQLFYTQLSKTQLFYDCIMNLSFTTELEPALADSLAFFSDLCSKVNPQTFKDDETRLFDLNETINNQTIVILPPVFEINGSNEEITIDILNSNSDFVYDTASNRFPRVKIELFVNVPASNSTNNLDLNNMSKSNSTNEINNDLNIEDKHSSRKDSIQINDSNKADSQSISSANNQLLNAVRKLNKIPSTPIGVRTRAEKLQEQKKIASKLTIKLVNNHKINEKNKNQVAKMKAFYFLSNSYSLWFLYLPEYLKACDTNAKTGLNYAYQVLNQMQKHNLTQPDEICYRIMMQLCSVYKFPTLAVKVLLHMRKYKIELNPITYSYYNKSMVEVDSWPSFQQDRWRKIRLCWMVICKFKQILIIKQKERLRQKKMARKSKKSRNGKEKKSKSKKNISKIKEEKEHRTNSNTIEILNIETDISKKTDSKSIISPIKNQNEYTNGIDKQIKENSFNKNKEKHFSCSDNDISSHLLSTSIDSNRKHSIQEFDTQRNPDHSQESPTRTTKINSAELNFTPVATSDPLTAFSTPNVAGVKKSSDEADDVKKRLFFYEPFKPVSSNNNNNNNIQKGSDFIFKKNLNSSEASSLNNNNTSENNSSKFVKKASSSNHRSIYDSDHYESDEYEDSVDEDDEDEEDYDEEDYYYNEEHDDEDISYDSEDGDQEDEASEDGEYYEHNTNKLNGSMNKFSLGGSNQGSVNDLNGKGASLTSDLLQVKNISEGDGVSYTSRKDSSLLEEKKSLKDNLISLTPFRVGSLMSKMGKSLENSGSKIKVVGQFLNEKYQETKEVILSNTSQQELSSKFKSVSNYGFNTNYINGLVKSSTSATGFVQNKPPINTSSKHTSSSDNIANGENSTLNKLLTAVDLDNVPTDDSFKNLSLKWWGLDRIDDFDYNLTGSDYGNLKQTSDVLIDIQMTSCNYCESCRTFLYDEEIMAGWTFNESDLNIKCAHCSSVMVPNLYIKIQDLDNIRKYIKSEESSSTIDTSNSSSNPEPEHPFTNLDDQNTKLEGSLNKPRTSSIINTNEITVQYLNPLVARKELENIISHTKIENDECLINFNFVEEHSVVFWNLIWYFKRIGVDSGQLALVLLNKRIKALKDQVFNDNLSQASTDPDNNNLNCNLFEFKNYIPNQKITKPYTQHPHVKIKCMWDNIKLQDKIEANEIPLYLSYLSLNQDIVQKHLKNRMVTILTPIELKSIRKSTINSRSLERTFESIIRQIKENDIISPIRNLIKERLRSKINYTSIYREILYLVLVALERDLIDLDAFDNEYRDAYKTLLKSETQELVKSSDKPPNNLTVWYRRLFSPLLL